MKGIFIAAPDGQAGGGMGRVKDYILQSPPDLTGQYRLVPLVTRDGRGVVFSVVLFATAMLRVIWAAIRGRIALLHVNLGDRGSLARKGLLVLGARACGVPTVLHLHAAELEQLHDKTGRLGRGLIGLPFRASTSIVVLGERYRAWLVEAFGIAPARIRILNNGVAAPPPRRAHGDGPQTLLFLGNMIERKGLSDLIVALGMMPPVEGGWRAVIVGGGDPAPYRALAEASGVGGQVEFPGWMDRADVQALLGGSDIMVLPSYDEGLPLVILEALGAGVPVICTPVGVIPEVLTDERTALFVPPGDRAALAAQMARLLGDRALQDGLAERAKALFDEKFSLTAFQDALFAIYRECCAVDYRPDRREGDR